ncbi:MAG TPA: hypothetical protein VK769_04785, partial [Verrucomicrobiae bacterium]|nr:hypothetical protein [Verrucomicrobiae bacterium]
NSTNSANATSGTNDFTGGTLDALIGTMQLGVSCPAGIGGTGNGTGTLTFNSGTLDVNILQLGVDTGNSGTSTGIGLMNVNGGLLNVNSNLQLGVFIAGSGGTPQGTLNVNGGTVQATNIVGGGSATINLKSGTLDLQNGQITNVTMLDIGDGQSSAAQLLNAASISSPNPITIAANGMLAGNTLVTTPNLLVNGAISPGNAAVGAVTNNGSVTFGAGGDYPFDMEDAIGQGGTNWDLLAATGVLNIQAASTNPFVVQLRSIDNDLNDGNPGAADFGNDSAQSWVIATASSITNFAANKFSVDDSLFQNDLAGGYFIVQTNGGSLLLAFVPNNPPSANDVSFYLPRNGVLQISISSLAAQWSDPDGDPVQLLGINGSSANGVSVTSDGNFIYYTSTTNSADTIFYTIVDLRTNPPAIYRAGDTQRTATGVIHILPPPAIANIVSSGGANLIFSGANGVPGGTYYVLVSTNLALPVSQWPVMSTNAFDVNGNFIFTNPVDANMYQQFYMLRFP